MLSTVSIAPSFFSLLYLLFLFLRQCRFRFRLHGGFVAGFLRLNAFGFTAPHPFVSVYISFLLSPSLLEIVIQLGGWTCLTGKLTCRTTLPSLTLSANLSELRHWVARHREVLLIAERALSLRSSTQGATLAATTYPATLSPSNLLAKQPSHYSFSKRLTQSFVADRFVLEGNSFSVSHTKQSTCRVSLPLTRPELCHLLSKYPSSDSPRALSVGGSRYGAGKKERERDFPWSEQDNTSYKHGQARKRYERDRNLSQRQAREREMSETRSQASIDWIETALKPWSCRLDPGIY
jgi:hypothetical protein